MGHYPFLCPRVRLHQIDFVFPIILSSENLASQPKKTTSRKKKRRKKHVLPNFVSFPRKSGKPNQPFDFNTVRVDVVCLEIMTQNTNLIDIFTMLRENLQHTFDEKCKINLVQPNESRGSVD